LIPLSWNRQADTDRTKADHDYQVNQRVLTYLIAWQRDRRSPDRRCIEEIGTYAEATFTGPGHGLAPRPDPAPSAAGPARTAWAAE
jgi:hypothetical protein